MKRPLGLLVLLLVPLAGLHANPRPPRLRATPWVTRTAPSSPSSEVVVRLRPGVGARAASQLFARAGARLTGVIPQLGIRTLRLSRPSAARALAASPEVLWVEPNRRRRTLLAPPNDPAYNDIDTNLPLDPDQATWFEWDARLIQCVDGWSRWPARYYNASGKGPDAVRIAVIDTGIDYSHPDFRNAGATGSSTAQGGQLERPLDRTVTNGQFTPEAPDEHGHGTHVAGIAAAATNNGRGCTGNGYNAKVVSLRVLDAAGNGTSADVARAITYAADNGVLICNMSIGDYEYSQAEQDAVDYAWSRGTLCIAAAGNDATDLKPNYPAALSRVLAVSATAREDRLALYSNYGGYVGLAAPGGDFDFISMWFLPVYSTTPTYDVTLNGPDYGIQRDYDYLSGTSMAAPQVAGLAALYAGYKGFTQNTPDVCLKIWQALQRGCDNIAGGSGGWDPYYGFGRINVYNTLNLDNDPNPRGAETGCIVGSARFRGTLVANAVVRAVPAGGGAAITGSSRADGGYRIANAPAGTYDVTATVFGESQVIQGVVVTAGCDMPGVTFDISGGPAPTPPAAPSGLAATVRSASRIDLSWTDNSDNETGFRLERKRGTEAYSELASPGANVTAHSDGTVEPDTTYTYRILAFNGAGNSAYSNEAQGVTPPAPSGPPNAPSSLVATAVSGSAIDLAWTDNSDNEDGFRLERKGPGDTWGEIRLTAANVTTYADTGLASSTTYTYRVRATNSSGNSAFSNEAMATTRVSPPAAPQNLTATAVSRTQVNLAWLDRSSDETGFKVERRTGGGGYGPLVTLKPGTTAFADTGLTSRTAYTYRVRATNAGGDSPASNEATATTFPDPPEAPTDLAVSVTSRTSLELAWVDRSDSESGFKIERRLGANPFEHLTTTGADAESFTDAGLTSETTYTYRVRAYNSGGHSAYSNEASGTTLPDPPEAPSELFADVLSTTEIELSWTDNSDNESGFELERRLSRGGFTRIAALGVDADSFTDTGLSPGTTYTYRIRAVNAGGASPYSNIETAATLDGPPAAPSRLRGRALPGGQVRLFWRDHSHNETLFHIERMDPKAEFVEIGVVGKNVRTFADKGLPRGATYYYRVRASNPAGHSAYSNIVRVRTRLR